MEETKAALTQNCDQQSKSKAIRRKERAEFNLWYTRQVNNKDIVDLSCGYVLGYRLLHPLPDGTMSSRHILDTLAQSDNFWEQRIAIVSTIALIREKQLDDTLRIVTRLLGHNHDLIHKAVGWMLRETGKQNIWTLREYLSRHSRDMARTTLRYAIERMDESERREWMGK